ncbi:MAG TPA: PAS domain S-box protein [Anaerolineales bacterium]|nr:PAS domain S-box protein [Anaerolineales bacterium]
MAPKIFLSHAGSDKKIAKLLAETLSRISLRQISIWFSSDPSAAGGIKPGQVWMEEIKTQLVASQVTLVLLTPNSLDRPWLYFESGYGFSNRKGQVIPLCLGMEHSQVPLPLAIFQCFEINTFESFTHFCKKLFALLHIRFDEEMSASILHEAVNDLVSASTQANAGRMKSENDVTKLRNQLEIYEEMVRAKWLDMPVPIHQINETGVICGVNEKWLEVFGYSREEVIGKPADFLMTSESAELAMLVVIPEFWEQGFCQGVRYQYKKKNGAIVDVILNCVETTNQEGNKISYSFVQPAVNTSALSQLRKDSNSRYREKLSRSAVGFYETDLLGKFTTVNNYLVQLLGFAKKELVGKNFREVLDPEFAKSIFNACHLAFTNRIQKSVYNWQIRRRNGEKLHVKTTVSLVTLPNGKAIGFRGTVQVIDGLGEPGGRIVDDSRQTA